MADTENITIREVQLLADRLRSGGTTTRMVDWSTMRSDLRLAAKVIRSMARNFNHANVVTIDSNGNGG